MNFKKLLMSCLSAAMVVSSLTGGAYATTESVEFNHMIQKKTLQEIPQDTLRENAKANSQQTPAPAKGGPAAWAFDNEDHWWHSRFQGTAGEGEVSSGVVSESNHIWIGTSFGEAKSIKKVTYQARTDNSGGVINKYKLMYANKTDGEPVDNDFVVAKEGNFANNTNEQTILLPSAVEATHIRLVACTVHAQSGYGNFASAKRVRVYEEVASEDQYNLYKEADFWDYETYNGTLGEQTQDDTWKYQIKQDGSWIDLPAGAFHETAWMCHANTADSTYFWAKLGKNNITSTFRTDGNKTALAFTWVAKQDGYYKPMLDGAVTEASSDPLDAYIWHLKNGETDDGTVLVNNPLPVGQTMEAKIVKVNAGDLIRFGAKSKNAYAFNFAPMVQELSVIDYARQYLEDVIKEESGYVCSEALRVELSTAKEQLEAAIGSDENVEVKLSALEAVVNKIKNYIPPTSIALSTKELNLEVGATGELNATIDPENALQEVVWSTSDESVATVNNGVVTAVAAGIATITATSVHNQELTATCTVNVTAKVNKGDLGLALTEARSYNQEDYTVESWSVLQDAIEQAQLTYESETATQQEVDDAVNTLMEVISSLKRLFKVTVNGQVVATGVYNQVVTITAPEAPAGQKFAGWELNGVIVSTSEDYTFGINGNLDFTAKFISVEEEVTQNPQALLTEVIMTTVSPTKSKVSFVNQIVIPKGYTVLGAGFAYTKDASIQTLHGENGILSDSRIKNYPTNILNINGQFSVSWPKVTKGSNIYSETWAKLSSPDGEIVWVYSPLIHTIIK